MERHSKAIHSAAAIQRLEDRRLLSLSVVNGVLTLDIQTSAAAHNIVVGFDSQTQEYTLSKNGHVHDFSSTGIDSLQIFGGVGANFIEVDASFPNVNADNGIKGGPGNDTILGSTGGHDVISTGQGNDSITGRGPDDIIDGNAGNDTIIGGSGANTIFGDNGNDSVQCNGTANVAVGGNGNDTIIAGSNNDSLYGKAGNDLLEGAGGSALMVGGEGADTLLGGSGSSTLMGGMGDDILAAGETGRLQLQPTTITPILPPPAAGKDSLEGDNGNDTLIGVSSTDTLSGGNGANEFNAPAGATLSDFNAAQGDFQASQQVYSGTPLTDISVTLSININGTPAIIPSTAGSFDSGDNTSVAEVTSVSGNTATVQFRDSTARTFLLGDFFNQWGVSFSAAGIAQYVNGPTGAISMTVNGVANTDFNNYVVKNGDAIVINFD